MRLPFPEVLDSTILSSFRACPRQAYLQYVEHWKPKLPSIHLHAGAAFARGLEVARQEFYENGRSVDDSIAKGLGALIEAYGAMECPADSTKSLDRMCGALEFYFDRYPIDRDHISPTVFPSGKRGIEFSFAEPLQESHPETGNPLIYSGRMDMIVDFAGGFYGEDDKTASLLGPSWSKQWDLRAQFMGYCWGAGKNGVSLRGFIVRGIAILKTKYDTQEAVLNFPQWMVDRWHEQTIRDVKRMKESWEKGEWDFNLGDSCNAYGGCMFRNSCLSQNAQQWLETGFVRRIWNPILRVETEVNHGN